MVSVFSPILKKNNESKYARDFGKDWIIGNIYLQRSFFRMQKLRNMLKTFLEVYGKILLY
jgi:hypothetical protein